MDAPNLLPSTPVTSTCGLCVHWQPRKNKEMAAHRMASCAHGPKWEFLPPHATCGRFVQMTDTAARVAWLGSNKG